MSFDYDARDSRTAIHYPDSHSYQFSNFDGFGNAQTITDPNGQTATLSFDQLNRETSRSYSGAIGTMGDEPDSVTVSYDANSNPKDITLNYSQSGSFNSSFSYDNYNRLTAVNDAYGRDIQYDYFINGNRKHVQVGNYAIDYLYENPTRLKSATATIPSVGTRSTQYSYDKSSLINQISQANNTTTTLSYDAAKRLSSIIHSAGNGAISSFNYGYDNHGNRTSQTEINGFGIENTSYSYNDLDQLVSVKYPNQETYHYTYDANYNRSTETVQDGGGIKLMDKTYSYNNRNQLSGLVDTVNSANNVSYTYDANGNQLSKTKGNDTTLFDYDSRNQLRRIRQNGLEQGLYLYDHQGMRISKTENGQQTKYLYDGKSVLQQYQNSADVKSHYFYGNNQLLQLHHVDEGLQYYHLDSLGSVVNLTLDNGSVQARYSYDAFGHTRQQAGGSANSFGFTGHEMDHNTGLIYMKARFYDPDVGRFLNQDSYEGTLDTPPSLHKYLYAYSNPLVYVDPDGHFAWLLGGATAETTMAAGAANSQQNWNQSHSVSTHEYKQTYSNSNSSSGILSGISAFFGGDSQEKEREQWDTAVQYSRDQSRLAQLRNLPYSKEYSASRDKEMQEIYERQHAVHQREDWVYISKNVNQINSLTSVTPTVTVEDSKIPTAMTNPISDPLPPLPGFPYLEPESDNIYINPRPDSEDDRVPSILITPIPEEQGPTIYVTPTQKQYPEWYVVYNKSDGDVTKKNPNDIELSHPANLSKTFSDPKNGTVGDLAEKLKADPSLADNIPPIEVAKIKGKTYSANNRRLRAFQEAGVEVNTVPASKEQVRKIKQRLQNKKK